MIKILITKNIVIDVGNNIDTVRKLVHVHMSYNLEVM